MLVSSSPCFCVLCAKFFALHGPGVCVSAKKFALHAQNGQKTLFQACWASFLRVPALRPGLVGGAAPSIPVAVGVLQH